MPRSIRKPELLAPAGNFEKLETAVFYGADAVYLAGKDFSLRNFSGNFSETEIPLAIDYAHRNNVKVYITCNIYSRNSDIKPLTDFLATLARLRPDGLIVADPGVVFLASQIAPDIDLHLSTQANTTNGNAVRFWESAGIKRVNLARELSLDEIKEITASSKLETEIFIHGAMCISYSGRCLLSSALTGRDSNRGLCSHPCRWSYAVVEEQRPGEFHSLMEDSRGSYIFNSRDLCMIDHIPQLIESGVSALKIEGRMKGIGYLASVVKTYRAAIDAYLDHPHNFTVKQEWHDELSQTYHRDYSTGFFFKDAGQILPNYQNISSGMIHSFIGKIAEVQEPGRIIVAIKNKISVHDTIEILPSSGAPKRSLVLAIFDQRGSSIDHAQPNTLSTLIVEPSCAPNEIIRKVKKN